MHFVTYHFEIQCCDLVQWFVYPLPKRMELKFVVVMIVSLCQILYRCNDIDTLSKEAEPCKCITGIASSNSYAIKSKSKGFACLINKSSELTLPLLKQGTVYMHPMVGVPVVNFQQ